MPENVTYYRYSLSDVFLPRLFGCIFLLIGLPMAVGGLWMLVQGLCKIIGLLLAWLSGTETWEGLFSMAFPMVVTGALSSIIPVILLAAGTTSLNNLPNIGIDDTGVYVQLFPIKWIFVPWADVLDLQLAPPKVHATDVLRWRREPLLFNRFRFAVWVGWWAGIPISSQIQGFDELMQTIRGHLAVAEQTDR